MTRRWISRGVAAVLGLLLLQVGPAHAASPNRPENPCAEGGFDSAAASGGDWLGRGMTTHLSGWIDACGDNVEPEATWGLIVYDSEKAYSVWLSSYDSAQRHTFSIQLTYPTVSGSHRAICLASAPEIRHACLAIAKGKTQGTLVFSAIATDDSRVRVPYTTDPFPPDPNCATCV